MARQIDLFCTPQLMDAGVPQPLRTADRCRSPHTVHIARVIVRAPWLSR